MSSGDQFNDLMKEIITSSSKVSSKEWSLSDYYFRMSDYFNQLKPSNGNDFGMPFDFEKDAEEFRLLAKTALL